MKPPDSRGEELQVLSSQSEDMFVDDTARSSFLPSENTPTNDKAFVQVGESVILEDTPHLLALGVEKRPDGFIHWINGSLDHPRNWTARRKAFDTSVIILFEFYT